MLKFGFADHLSESHRPFVCASVFLDGGQCGLCTSFAEDVGKGTSLDPWDAVGLRTTSIVWNVPKKYGPHGELFFFHFKKQPFVLTKAVEFRPCVTAETLVACALIGWHMTAEEAPSLSLSGLSPEFGRGVEVGGPRNPLWKGDVRDCYEHNVECRALEVILLCFFRIGSLRG